MRVQGERDEARELACALLNVVRELVDSMGDLTRIDSRLDYDGMPHWLTGVVGAPDEWERGEDDLESDGDEEFEA